MFNWKQECQDILHILFVLVNAKFHILLIYKGMGVMAC